MQQAQTVRKFATSSTRHVKNVLNRFEDYKNYKNTGDKSYIIQYISNRFNYIKQSESNPTAERLEELKEEASKFIIDDVNKKFENADNYEKLGEFIENFNSPIYYINKYKTFTANILNLNFKSLNDIQFNADFFKTYGLSERVIYDNARFYLDIDISSKDLKDDDENSDEIALRELKNKIVELYLFIKSINKNVNIFGVIELNGDMNIYPSKNAYNVLVQFLNDFIKLYNFAPAYNTEEGFKKLLSCHIYISGVSVDRIQQRLYMKQQFAGCLGFDVSVYSDGQHLFRHPLSGKGNRPANRNLLNYLSNPNNVEYFKNMHICPTSEDVYLDLSTYITPETKQAERREIVKQNREYVKFKQLDISGRCSIFRFVKIGNEIHDLMTESQDELDEHGNIIKNGLNHFELSQALKRFERLPLSYEEFKGEVKKLRSDVDANDSDYFDKFESKILYIQDYTQIKILYNLAKWTNEKLEEIAEELKNKPEDQNLKQLQNEAININNIIYNYINKYAKFDFVRHNFFNADNVVYNPIDGTTSKKYMLMYNCYNNSDGSIVYLGNSETEPEIFKTVNVFKNRFHLSGTVANEIHDSLTYFDNHRDFAFMRLEANYEALPNSTKTELQNNINDFLELYKSTFERNEDYLFTLGFYASKLTFKNNVRKGIINQKANGEISGMNSLKTFMNDLVKKFINIKSPSSKDLTEVLNGTFLNAHLTVIEELPFQNKQADALIEQLKRFSNVAEASINEKFEKPRDIINKTNFILNTNHDVSNYYAFASNAEPLAKRFRICTRKSINIHDKNISSILDKVNPDNIMACYTLYKYLYNNNDLINYFNDHRDDIDPTTQIYLSSAINKSDSVEKIITNYDFEAFKDWFKSSFVSSSSHQIKIKELTKYFSIQTNNQKLQSKYFKAELIRNQFCTALKDGHIKISDDQMKLLYDYYFEYDEPEEVKEIQI